MCHVSMTDVQCQCHYVNVKCSMTSNIDTCNVWWRNLTSLRNPCVYTTKYDDFLKTHMRLVTSSVCGAPLQNGSGVQSGLQQKQHIDMSKRAHCARAPRGTKALRAKDQMQEAELKQKTGTKHAVLSTI